MYLEIPVQEATVVLKVQSNIRRDSINGGCVFMLGFMAEICPGLWGFRYVGGLNWDHYGWAGSSQNGLQVFKEVEGVEGGTWGWGAVVPMANIDPAGSQSVKYRRMVKSILFDNFFSLWFPRNKLVPVLVGNKHLRECESPGPVLITCNVI